MVLWWRTTAHVTVRWPTVLTPAYVVLPKKPHSGQNLFVRKPPAGCGPLGHNVREAPFLFCQEAPDILKPLDRFPHLHISSFGILGPASGIFPRPNGISARQIGMDRSTSGRGAS